MIVSGFTRSSQPKNHDFATNVRWIVEQETGKKLAGSSTSNRQANGLGIPQNLGHADHS
jgi:hypothetical protein